MGLRSRRVELIHTGTLTGLWLLAELAGWFLGMATDGAGGLGGLHTQTLVQTVSTVLRVLVLASLPFLSVARSGAALRACRGEDPQLLPGLARWRAVLVTALPVGLRCLLTGFVASYLAEQIFFLTPMAAPVYQAALSGGDLDVALAETSPFLTLIFLPVFALLCLPTVYHWRGLSFLIADRGIGGFPAAAHTGAMNRWRKVGMLLGDLSRWWYHLPMGLGLGLMGASWLCQLLELELPMPGWILTLVGSAVVLICDLTVGPGIRLARARQYELHAATPPEPKKRPAPRPEDLPWNGWDHN